LQKEICKRRLSRKEGTGDRGATVETSDKMSATTSAVAGPEKSAPKGFRPNWRLVVSILAILLAVVTSVYWGAKRNPQEGFYGFRLFPSEDAYNFSLIDQNGQPLELAKLHGKVVLFTFGFTHCPDVCPTTLTDLSAVYKALPARDQKRVQLVFISVDPQRDKPEALKEYIPSFDPNIIGLTGSKESIDNTVKTYGASYEIDHHPGDDPNVYFMTHSAYTYLINPHGKWELIYDYEKLKDTNRIAADIEKVLSEW
jgi:protein SCO1